MVICVPTCTINYLIGPADSSNIGRDTVTVFDDGLELFCFNTISELNDGAMVDSALNN